MLYAPTQESRFVTLVDALRRAQQVDTALVARILTEACSRIAMLRRAGKASHIDRLIGAEAWRELAFALIENELPAWTLRRLAHEDGEWHCALLRQPNLPLDVDDLAEASHASLPLAIFAALLEVRRRLEATPQAVRAPVPQMRVSTGHAMCCENFS